MAVPLWQSYSKVAGSRPGQRRKRRSYGKLGLKKEKLDGVALFVEDSCRFKIVLDFGCRYGENIMLKFQFLISKGLFTYNVSQKWSRPPPHLSRQKPWPSSCSID